MSAKSRAARDEVQVVLDADVVPEACPVGTLYHASGRGGGVFSFEYDDAWLRRPDAFEIDPGLQLVGGETYPANTAGVFRIFLDSAPDRWGRVLLERREAMRARAENRAARTLGEWDFLLGVHDTARMGALRFRATADGPFLDNDEHHAAPPLATLRELEAAALSLENPDAEDSPQYRAWLTALLAPGSSLGGHRPKANFTDTDGSLWIAKFQSRQDRRDVGALEMLVHQLAAEAGIDVPAARVFKLGSEYRTFACQRFDRAGARRRFFVSAMTLLQREDGSGGSYLELADYVQTRGSADHIAADLGQLWTRVVFNVLVRNTDDHLRNHGFIYSGDGWRLAPSYDVNVNPGATQHALAIDGRDHTGDVQLALDTAGFYGLDAAAANEILARVRSVLATWREKARRLALSRGDIALIEPVLDAS
ncbi:MAG: type II toxin-antitoxin system HipA family toxin [Opitutaceae bacterium]|nr:type II toxin-antitoxin system HipA family toxin [Opitutaceae bacterium]